MRNDVDDAASLSLCLQRTGAKEKRSIVSPIRHLQTRQGCRAAETAAECGGLHRKFCDCGIRFGKLALRGRVLYKVSTIHRLSVCVWRRACCDTGAPPPPDIVRRQVPPAPRRREKYGWGYRVPRNKPLGRSSSLEMPLSLSSYLTFVRFFSNIYINSPLPARRWSHIDARGLCGVGLQSKHRHTGSRDVRISKK